MPDAIIESEDSGSQGTELCASMRAIIDIQLILASLGKLHREEEEPGRASRFANLSRISLRKMYYYCIPHSVPIARKYTVNAEIIEYRRTIYANGNANYRTTSDIANVGIII